MGDAGISSSSLQTFFDAFGFHANFLRLLVDNQAKGCTDQPTTTIYHACAAPSNAGGMGSAAERVLNQLHPGLPEPLVLDVLAQAAIPRARVQDAKEA